MRKSARALGGGRLLPAHVQLHDPLASTLAHADAVLAIRHHASTLTATTRDPLLMRRHRRDMRSTLRLRSGECGVGRGTHRLSNRPAATSRPALHCCAQPRSHHRHCRTADPCRNQSSAYKHCAKAKAGSKDCTAIGGFLMSWVDEYWKGAKSQVGAQGHARRSSGASPCGA